MVYGSPLVNPQSVLRSCKTSLSPPFISSLSLLLSRPKHFGSHRHISLPPLETITKSLQSTEGNWWCPDADVNLYGKTSSSLRWLPLIQFPVKLTNISVIHTSTCGKVIMEWKVMLIMVLIKRERVKIGWKNIKREIRRGANEMRRAKNEEGEKG